MDYLADFVDGLVKAFGMWLMFTVLGILSWFAMKKWMLKTLREVWLAVKEGKLDFDNITIEGKISRKKRGK